MQVAILDACEAMYLLFLKCLFIQGEGGHFLFWRQIWPVAGRESGSSELLEVPHRLPRKFPELPRKFPSDFPGCSVKFNSNPDVPQKFPRLPRKLPGLPRRERERENTDRD